jgi:iron-sulfur cluster assembly 2
VVDSASFDLVKGATLDYKEELIKSAFVVSNNPQSESACGCGSSFAVKNFTANPAVD